MKTLIGTLALFFVLAPASAHGQISITALGGIGLTTLSGGDGTESSEYSTTTYDTKRKTGMQGRVFLTVPFTDSNGSIQLGLGYARGGTSIVSETEYHDDDSGGFFDFEDDETKVNLHFDYLELPILVKYTLLDSGRLLPYLAFGPKLSYLVGCTFDASFLGLTLSESCFDDDDFEDTFNKLDVAGHVGAGVDFAITPSVMLTLDASYNHGFLSPLIAEDLIAEEADLFGSSEGKNRGFSLLAGVTIPLP